MKRVTIWHNPRCSKSRAALAYLQEQELDLSVVKYLEKNPSYEDLKEVLVMLGMSPRDLMRSKEELYKELGLNDENDETRLIDAMVKHPKLIERPVIIYDNQAVIARPLENIEALLK